VRNASAETIVEWRRAGQLDALLRGDDPELPNSSSQRPTISSRRPRPIPISVLVARRQSGSSELKICGA
jgi:hypothetical protein